MNLKGKVVVITGASSGIGRATAKLFAAEGASVVINYRVNKKGADEVLEELRSAPDSIAVQADVSKPDEVDQLFDKTLERFPSVDVLINNAAIPTDKVPFMEASYDDIKEMIDTDLISVMLSSRRAASIMKKQGSGKILNTSSVRGWEYGSGSGLVYAASKAAVNSFTRSFAKQVAPEIQVNAVAPGFVKTRVYDERSKERLQGFLDQTYLKRWITPDEIADAFLFLAKNDAITGQVLYVDAGFQLK